MTERSQHPFAVRAGTTEDAADAARLHAGQITEGFLPTLGAAFLQRLYRRIAVDRGSFLLTALDGDDTVGFIAGSMDVKSLYRTFLLRDGAMAMFAALPKVIRSWRRVLETLGHGYAAPNGAELLAVAVEPSVRGRGVGESLVAGFLDEVRRRGGDEAYVVVGALNQGAVSLYRRTGFELDQELELHPGTKSLVLCWRPGAR